MLGELIPLAMSLAHHYEYVFKQDYGEFETAALYGAWDAIKRHDNTKGASLRTYAYQRITGTIIDWHRQEMSQKGGWRDPKNRKVVTCVDFNDLGWREDGSMSDASKIEYEFGRTSERGYSLVDDRELLRALKLRMDAKEWDIMVRCVCNEEYMKDVGKSYGVSEARICQILPVALKHARKIINDMNIEQTPEDYEAEREQEWIKSLMGNR